MSVPIVYLYPGARWGAHVGRQQLLPEALARLVPVVFLSTADPTRGLLDMRRPRIEHPHPGVTVVHDALALRTNRWWRRVPWVSDRIDGYLLRRALRSVGIHDYVYWLSAPEPRWVGGMLSDRLVYDCIDPFFLLDDAEGARDFDAREYAVAADARVVFCTAQTLLERMQRVHQHAYLLNNAGAPELYTGDVADRPAVPAALEGRSRPIIGYVGTIDWRIDCDTLAEAARTLPDYTFCLVGRVNADQESRVAQLRSLPNVLLPGEVPPGDGAAYNAAFDVGVLPYLPGPSSDAVNPVKMYMYLLAGLPVVSTWTNESRLAQPHVRPTQTPAEFAQALRDAVSRPDEQARAARIAFARQNTWDERARRAVDVLRENGLLPPPS